MKNMYLSQAGLLVLGSFFLFLFREWHAAASFAAGAGLVFANVVLLGWLWGRILAKKLVALSVLIIVFKYAILGAILYLILTASWVSPIWFCVGIGTVMFSSLGAALFPENALEETDEWPSHSHL